MELDSLKDKAVKAINASIKLAKKETDKSEKLMETFQLTLDKLNTEINNYKLQLMHLDAKEKDALKKNRNISESERIN